MSKRTEPQERWRSIVTATVLKHAKHMQIIPWDETDMKKLPEGLYEFLSRRCELLVRQCCDSESVSRHRSIEQRVNAELWNLMKPWNQNPALREKQTALFGDPP